ncbi:beta strand repeat-containing protein, partial [Flavobacterium sp.]|uniref:beta strand repeat-containing protein n=1 Tax=Flavobacterium sp. TaxID=239 RepID=UPI003B9D918A
MFSLASYGQTTLIDATGAGNFEGANFAADGWTVVQGTAAANNNFLLGGAGVIGFTPSGSQGVAITTNGTGRGYNLAANSWVWMYRDVTVNAGETVVTGSMTMIGNPGDLGYDGIVMGVSETSFTASITTGAGGVINATSVPGMTFARTATANTFIEDGNYATATTRTFTFPLNAFGNASASTTRRVWIGWRCDSSFGNATTPMSFDAVNLASRAPGSFVSTATGGNWSSAATWVGGVVPASVDNATIADGATVTIDIAGLSVNNLTVGQGASGILTYAATPTAFTVAGNLTVNSGGTFNVFQGTTGKTLNVAGNISNSGTINLSVGSITGATLVLNGALPQTIGGTGTWTANEIRNLTFNNTNPVGSIGVNWNVSNISVSGTLTFTNGLVALGSANSLRLGISATAAGTLSYSNGGFLNGKFIRWWTSTGTGSTITAGTNPTAAGGRYPFVNLNGQQRSAFVERSTALAAGQLSCTYVDATTTSTVAITDGVYNVTQRFDGNWTFSTEGSAYAATNNEVAFLGTGAYIANNGNSRVIGASAAIGTNQAGSNLPMAQRLLTVAQLTSGPLYIGANSVDIQQPCTGTPSAGVITGTLNICSNTSTILTSTGFTAGVTGITLQWQQSTDNGVSWVNAVGGSGATTAVYTTPEISSAISYRLLVTCTSSGFSATSATQVINLLTCTYNTAISPSTYTSIMPANGGTGTPYSGWVSTTSGDDNTSTIVNLSGTTFQYQGQTVSGFRACTNGWMTFNTASTSVQWTNDLTSTAQNLILAPFWDDLVVTGQAFSNLNASMRYQISGTLGSGSAVITLEWAGLERFNIAGPNLNFQVKLYEAGNVIEYIYGDMQGFDGTFDSAYSYSVGYNGSSPAAAATRLIQQTANTNFFASTNQTGLNIIPTCNTKITLTPGTYAGLTSAPAASAPSNDESASAIVLPVIVGAVDSYCGDYFNSRNATNSGAGNACGAAGNQDDDVWFRFNTTASTGYSIILRSSPGYNGVLQLLDSTLTEVTCINATTTGAIETITADSLIPNGQTYFIRVFHNGAGSGTSGEFALTVQEVIPAPANDNITGAIALSVNGTATSSILPNAVAATASPQTVCTGAADDDQWFSFVANSADQRIIVTSAAGYNAVFEVWQSSDNTPTGTLSQFTGSCTNAASTGLSETFTGNSFVIGNTYFIRVYHFATGPGSGNFTIRVLNLPPACVLNTAPLNNQAGVSLTPTLNWDASVGAIAYDIYLGTIVGAETLLVANVPGTTYTIPTPLSGQTTYSWYVVPKDANNSAQCTSANGTVFTTVCNALTTFPYLETFESNSSTLQCLGVINADGGGTWGLTTTNPRTNAQAISINTATATSNNDFVVLPRFSLDGIPKRLVFYARASANNTPAEIEVRLSTTGILPTDFTTVLLPSTPVTSTSYNAYVVDLTAYVDTTVAIALVRAGSPLNGGTLTIDDLTVEDIPACANPSALIVSPLTQSSASVSWTAPSNPPLDGYEFAFTTSSLPPTSGDPIASNSTTVTGLTTGLTYYLHVRSVCATGTTFSSWSTSVPFTLPIVAPLPWSEPFTLTGTPAGWNTSGWSVDGFTGGAGNPGNKLARNLTTGVESGSFTTLIAGTVATGDVFVFDYSFANATALTTSPVAGACSVTVQVSTNYGATFTTIDTFSNNGSTGWFNRLYNLSAYVGSDVQFRINVTRLSGNYFALFDNFGIQPNCSGAPNGGTVSAPTQSLCSGATVAAITVTGASSGAGISYQWQQSTDNGVSWVNAVGGTGATTLTYTPPVFAGSTIQYRLRVNCSGSGQDSFSTVAEINSNPSAVPFTETFDTLNSSWTISPFLLYDSTGVGVRGVSGNSGNAIYRNVWSSSTTGAFRTTRYGPIVAGQSFSYDYRCTNLSSPFAATASNSGTFIVAVSTDCGVTFTDIDTFNNVESPNFQTRTVSLAAYVGQTIIVRLTANWIQGDFDAAFDNVGILVAPPSINSFTPNTVCGTGSQVVITGQNFGAVTAVSFNGVSAAAFNVDSATQITATVPAGATTGPIVLTAPQGDGTSGTNFTINSIPNVDPIAGANNVCKNSTISLTNPTLGGVWSSQNPGIATVNSSGVVTGVTPGTATIVYTVTVSGCTNFATKQVIVDDNVAITTQPGNAIVVSGDNTSFAVAASNVTTYQWFYSPDGVVPFVVVPEDATFSGTTSATLNVTNTPASLDGYRFYVVASGAASCAAVTSNTVTLTIGDTGIATQPQNVALCDSGDATFTVVGSGTVNGYQWYVIDNTIPATPVAITDGGVYSGATTATLTITGATPTLNGYRYFVILDGPVTDPTSNQATLSVAQTPTVSAPADASICFTGGSTNLVVTTSNAVSTAWQYSTSSTGPWSAVADNTPAGATYTGFASNTLSVTTTAATPVGTYFYRAVVAGTAPCASVNSSSASLTISQPVVGAQPANTSVRRGNAATLTVSSPTPGATYQWQRATTVNGTYSNVVNGTPTGLTFTGATTATLNIATAGTAAIGSSGFYRCVITTIAGCSVNSNAVTFTVLDYCNAAATNTGDTDIARVVFGGLANPATLPASILNNAAANALYTDFTGLTPVVSFTQGTSYPISVAQFTSGGTFYQAWTKIFIDWNQDLDFEDAGEVYNAANGVNGPATSTTPPAGGLVFSSNITIPFTALTGTTRMRVLLAESGSTTSNANGCGTFTFGEVEDYTINIVAADACTGTPVAGTTTSTITSTCSGGNATLSLTGASSGVTGLSYQWFSRSLPSGTFAAISGANSETYAVTNLTQGTEYYCRVTCTNSNEFADSTPVSIAVVNCEYSVSANDITYSSIMSTGSTYTGLFTTFGNATDGNDVRTNNVSLAGTTFLYNGAPVTGFYATSNGWMTFNTAQTATTGLNDLGGTINNVLAPFWDDLQIQGNVTANRDSSMRYSIAGTLGSGSAVITVEWAQMSRFGYADSNLNFQVVLRESDNSIEFNYGTMQTFNGSTNVAAGNWSYSVGLNSSIPNPVLPATATTRNRLVLQNENSVNFSATSQNDLRLAPDCGSQIRFVPAATYSGGSAPSIVPANNELATAFVIPVNASPCLSTCGNVYSSRNATASTGIAACAPTPSVVTGNADDDVFFKFTTDSVLTSYTINVIPSVGYDAFVQILDSSFNSVRCLNSAGAGLTETLAQITLNTSSEYYIRVYDTSTGESGGVNGSGNFAICVNSQVSPPAYDEPAGAISLTLNGTCTPVNSTPADISRLTATTGVQACSASTPGNADDDAWFTFTTPASTNGLVFNVRVQGNTTYNPVVQIFSGNPALNNAIACANSTGAGAIETFSSGALVANTQYYVRVYHSGTGSASGDFTICAFVTVPSCLTVPSSPANNGFVCGGGNTVNLTWAAVANATGYDVFFDAGTTATTQVATNQTGTSFTTPALGFGQYAWRVVPRNAFGSASGCSTFTFTVQSTSIAGTPSANQTICTGTQPAPITLTGHVGNVQWQVSTNNTFFTNIAGATSATLTSTQMGTLTANRFYRAVVTNTPCSSVNTASVSVTVNPVATAGTVSANQTICAGSTPNAITITGQNGTIQWQVSSDNVAYTDIPGETSSTLSASSIGALTSTRFYRAQMTSGVCPVVNSSVVTVTVNPQPVAGTVSSDQTICSGTAPANITLTGSLGSIQWQVSTDNNLFTNISGQTTATLSGAAIGNLSQTRYYRARVSGIAPCGFVDSAVVTVTVNPAAVAGTVSSNQTICSGSEPSNIVLTGSVGTIQWQESSDNNVFTDISGQTSATLSGSAIGALTSTRFYRAVVSGLAPCTPVNSAVVTVSVNATSVAGTASSDQTICTGTQPADITLTGNTGTIQWQVSSDNNDFANISGATSATLTAAEMGTLTATRYYRAVVTSGTCSAVNSTVVTVTVNALTVPTFTPVAAVCYNTTIPALPTTSNNGITGSWSPALNNLATTTYTFTPNSGQCADVTTLQIVVNSTTWDGTAWSNGAPSSTVGAIFGGNYNQATDITTCSLTVANDATVVIPSGS